MTDLHGNAPQVSIESGRKMVPDHLMPSFHQAGGRRCSGRKLIDVEVAVETMTRSDRVDPGGRKTRSWRLSEVAQ